MLFRPAVLLLLCFTKRIYEERIFFYRFESKNVSVGADHSPRNCFPPPAGRRLLERERTRTTVFRENVFGAVVAARRGRRGGLRSRARSVRGGCGKRQTFESHTRSRLPASPPRTAGVVPASHHLRPPQ